MRGNHLEQSTTKTSLKEAASAKTGFTLVL